MIDEDDDDIPSFVVSSGSEHHVSVSEHTGNAKTPHNKVVSHEEETQARKLAFEKHDGDSDSSQKHDAHDETVHAQKIANDVASANTQAIDNKAQAQANVQAIPTFHHDIAGV